MSQLGSKNEEKMWFWWRIFKIQVEPIHHKIQDLKKVTIRFKKWGKNVILLEVIQNSGRAVPSKSGSKMWLW